MFFNFIPRYFFSSFPIIFVSSTCTCFVVRGCQGVASGYLYFIITRTIMCLAYGCLQVKESGNERLFSYFHYTLLPLMPSWQHLILPLNVLFDQSPSYKSVQIVWFQHLFFNSFFLLCCFCFVQEIVPALSKFDRTWDLCKKFILRNHKILVFGYLYLGFNLFAVMFFRQL